MNAIWRTFWVEDEGGAEMVEWAVVTVILLVATVPLLLALNSELIDMFRRVFEVLQDPPPTDY